MCSASLSSTFRVQYLVTSKRPVGNLDKVSLYTSTAKKDKNHYPKTVLVVPFLGRLLATHMSVRKATSHL